MKIKHLNSLLQACWLLWLAACDPPATSRPYPNPKLTQHKQQHKRGLAENPQRVLLGMRPIGEKWFCFRCTDAGDEWIIDPVHDQAAVKMVRRDSDGNPLLERDQYCSGRRYIDLEGDESIEEFRVECDWKTGVISIAYLGDDSVLEKAIANLPPFSSQTRTAYLDLVASVEKKWKTHREEAKP
jgi:hypothetical protein